MKIQSMFQKNINRDINGVIKVAQDDEQSLVQELVNISSPRNSAAISILFQ